MPHVDGGAQRSRLRQAFAGRGSVGGPVALFGALVAVAMALPAKGLADSAGGPVGAGGRVQAQQTGQNRGEAGAVDSAAAPEPAVAGPENSKPHPAKKPAAPSPCDVRNAGASMASTEAMRGLAAAGVANLESLPRPAIANLVVCVPHAPPIIDWYARFLTGPQVKPFTPVEKGRLAVRNVIDPFNLMTIAGESGISTALNPHSVYGPGFYGWSKSGGVALTQDMTGEFFGTFLIPSIVHQDPHYHRMPKASIPRRMLHCIDQIGWTQGDNGKGMVNYADLVGFALDDAVGDLYVPGQQTNFRASAIRYGTGLGTAPIDNFITEFLPDIARHIHVRVVLVQRIINQVARTNDTP